MNILPLIRIGYFILCLIIMLPVFLYLNSFKPLHMPSYNLQINEKTYTVEADAKMPLLWVIRDLVGLTGTKYGCGIAQCGACTVHLNGNAVRSCTLPVSAAVNQKI